MYLIKNIFFDRQYQNLIVKDGILIGQFGENNRLNVQGKYWGKADVYLEEDADFSKFPISNHNSNVLLSYINEYDVKDIYDGYKEFSFHVSAYQSENIEGYIIFIRKAPNITTNGEKLFGRYPTEIVAVLRDGEHLDIDGKRIEVINKKLMMHI